MQPTVATTETKPTSQRLRRFERQPDRLQSRQITPKSLEVLAAIERYRFLPSSLAVRLVEGGQRNNYRHLQTLFHKGLANRFPLPTAYGTPGEFVYYLDTISSLTTLIQHGETDLSESDRKRREQIIRLNREKNYSALHKDPDQQGKLLYIQHEIMISRFHALLELGSRKTNGTVQLEQWKQGPELWNRVEVPEIKQNRETGRWEDLDKIEYLPHRPDAFFTLYFPTKPEGQQRSHFLYEADRGTENTTRFKMKLRAHWHFTVKQRRHRTGSAYGVHAIRAVLIESTDMHWAHQLRESAKHPIVSNRPSPLFWFTTSDLFTKPVDQGNRTVPRYLLEPELIFSRIWATPVEDKFLNLTD